MKHLMTGAFAALILAAPAMAQDASPTAPAGIRAW